MSAAIAHLADWVAASDFGQWASGSAIAYPLANVVHLLGLVMLVGAIGIVDLRLAGAFRALAVVPLSRALTRIAIAGLVLMIPSGATMVAADTAVMQSPVFRWKLALIVIALANAAAFRMIWRERFLTWDAAPPIAGRLMAAGSILLWLTIGGLGRMIAYS
jgi:ethanolamine utilization microcompartment shell protein EutS